MDEKKKWTVKDVITTVLLSAVLIVETAENSV